jgi:hypothetical protein
MESLIKYKYWKWSNSNIKQLKTLRKKKDENQQNNRLDKNTSEINQHKLDIDLKIARLETIEKKEPNKREMCNNRISQRDMLIQTNVNPFLTKETYVDNIRVQDNFLRPLDSNFKI